MSFVTVLPEASFPAASNLQGIVEGAEFRAHAQMYKAVSTQAAPIQVCATTLSAGGESYAATEAATAVATG